MVHRYDLSRIPNEDRLLPHIHTVGIAPTFFRYCGGSNQIGDWCMGCLPRLIWGVLTQHRTLFVRLEYLRSVDILSAKARLNLLLVMTAERDTFVLLDSWLDL